MMIRRSLGEPDAQRECSQATRHDFNDKGHCRFCERGCNADGSCCIDGGHLHAAPSRADGHDDNDGDLLIMEAYAYYWGTDEADLPYWYHGVGRELGA